MPKLIKMSLLVALIFVFSLASLVNGETQNRFSITEIKIEEGIAQIILNDSIEIKSIQLVVTSSGTELNLPMGIEIEDEYLEESITSAIESGEPSEKKIKSVSYKITELVSNEEYFMASVVFNNVLLIQCRILEGEKGPWVLWPEDFRIIKSLLRKMVERSLIAKYKEERSGENE
jgi:DNA-binding cell septation regulator SpoVG